MKELCISTSTSMSFIPAHHGYLSSVSRNKDRSTPAEETTITEVAYGMFSVHDGSIWQMIGAASIPLQPATPLLQFFHSDHPSYSGPSLLCTSLCIFNLTSPPLHAAGPSFQEDKRYIKTSISNL